MLSYPTLLLSLSLTTAVLGVPVQSSPERPLVRTANGNWLGKVQFNAVEAFKGKLILFIVFDRTARSIEILISNDGVD
jgi:hypothetical protein